MKSDDRWSPLLPPDDPATAPREYTSRTKVQRYKTTSWHLAHLSPTQSALIKKRFGSTARGWGSIRILVRIGKTEWATSLFPSKESKSYLFVIKAAVRKAENLSHGDRITARIRIA